MRRAAAGFLTLALAIGASPFRLHIPGEGWMRRLPGQAGLDYGHFGSEFAPLTEGFIADELGTVIAAQPVPSRRAGTTRTRSETTSPLIVEHPLTNDHLDDAQTIPRVPYTAHTDATSATRTSGEDPSDCAEAGVTTWYSYRASRDMDLTADTIGTANTTTLGVFEEVPSGLRKVDCDWNLGGNAAVTFMAKAAHRYLFQITSARGGRQTFHLIPEGKTEAAQEQNWLQPGGGRYRSPSLSADGRILAFLSDDEDLGVPQVPCPSSVAGSNTDEPFGTTSGNVWYHGNWLWYPNLGGRTPCLQLFVQDLASGAPPVMASRNADGEPANAHVLEHMLSGDGRSVAFNTFADNLVPHDTNDLSDVFVRDLARGRLERASVTNSGAQLHRGVEDVLASNDAASPSISFDGRYVFFESSAPNLASKSTAATDYFDQTVDVYVRDVVKRTTTRVSVSTSGEVARPAPHTTLFGNALPSGQALPFGSQENDERIEKLRSRSALPCISRNGRFVAFRSFATNFSDVEWQGHPQIYVRDLRTRVTELVSVSNAGRPANSDETYPGRSPFHGPSAKQPCVSDDGRFVVIASDASNLAKREGKVLDIFVRDRTRRATILVSASPPHLDDFGLGRDLNSAYLTGQREDPGCIFPPPIYERTCVRVGANQGGIAADGSMVVFDTYDPIEDGDDNACSDIYAFDLRSAAVTRISSDKAGFFPSALGLRVSVCSFDPAVSSDGGVVAYHSNDGSPVYAAIGEAIHVYRRDVPR